MSRIYLTTSIPYVNATPHLGHALEFVQADVLARHRRQRGDEVRLLSGTDDNALKNVAAAKAAGVAVAEFVDRNAERFLALGDDLDLSFDDFIRTSSDVRHRVGVEHLWRSIADAGLLERATYEGRYCIGCEEFVDDGALVDGVCAEHLTVPEDVAETNWFFRLSAFGDRIEQAISSGRLLIEPAARRREVLAFVRAGLRDVSISRDATRAGGWGIPVPGDPSQVIYVWVDALANYITALGFGSDEEDFDHWWGGAGERIHVIGKGIIRFHAVLWPALLLAAGEQLPTHLFVHDYLTVDGQKISKSLGTSIDPTAVARRVGAEALRWWFTSEVPPAGDTDFTIERLVERADQDLANGIGNLTSRITALLERHRAGLPLAPDPAVDVEGAAELGHVTAGLDAEVTAVLARFDLRAATDAIRACVTSTNRFLEDHRPWEHPTEPAFDTVLGTALKACRAIGVALTPFTPRLAAQVIETLTPPITRSGPLVARLHTGSAATVGRR